MRKSIVAVFSLVFFGVAGVSAQNNDNIEFQSVETLADIKTEEAQINASIDSLLQVWYVKNAVKEEFKSQSAYTAPIYYPDSVYRSCLKKIPTTFPLVYNQQVKNWIEMYIRRGKYTIPTLLGLSNYYFPMIEQVFDKYGLPLELKYLIVVESAMNPRAVSRSGAVGLWQFMYITGKQYNLEVSTLIDQRRDPEKETEAAAKYLRDLYSIYGDWALVIAAYNCGPGNVNKAMRRSGGKRDFWDIYPWLPTETRGYVPAFISVNYIMNFYKQHNFSPVKVDMPMANDTVLITNKLHFEQVSNVLNYPIEKLRDLNPQYKLDIIPGDINVYSLRLPSDLVVKFAEHEKEIYAYKDSVYFSPKEEYVCAASASNSSASAASYSVPADDPCDISIPAGSSKLIYTVKSGDTYGFIADWYDVSVQRIKCWNNVTNNRLSPGEKLVVYVPTKKLNSYKNIEHQSFAQKQAAKSNAIVREAKSSGKPLDAHFEYYTIRSGDNLSDIAAKYPGVSGADIMRLNGFSSYDVKKLQIGQVIKIKRK